MKICFILEHFYPHVGGVETEFLEFTKNLYKMGNEVRVVTSNSGGIEGKSNVNGIDVYHHDWKSLFGHPIPDKVDMKDHILWADVVHTTTYTAGPPTVSICRRYNKPCVISEQEYLGKDWHAIEDNFLKVYMYRVFEKYVTSRKYDIWHANSESTKRNLISSGVDQHKVRRIYLGIDNTFWNPDIEALDVNSYLGYDKKDKIILYFGRPGKTKGIFILLDAINKISNRLKEPEYKDFRFGFIMSNDPMDEKLRFLKYVKEYNLGGYIKVCDSVDRESLRGYIKSSYCIVVPSLTEGFGFSAAETCALGVPIVSSDAGSLKEVVSGKHLFFRKGDSDDLSQKLLTALGGKFDYMPPKKFEWYKASVQLLELYKELI